MAVSGIGGPPPPLDIIGAASCGLAWQGAAITAPLLIRHAVDAGIVHHHRSSLWWACAGIAVLGAIEAAGGAAAPHLRDPELRAGGCGRPRRDLPPGARARRALPRPGRRRRADLARVQRRELVARLFDAIGHTLGYVLAVVGVSTVLLVVDWRLALAVLAPLPLVSIGFGRYSRRYAERTKINQEELAELTTLAEETIAGIRVAKGLGAGDALSARFRRQSGRVVDTALAVADVDAVFLPALEALPLIGVLVAVWYGRTACSTATSRSARSRCSTSTSRCS